ncbi:TPA_asm: 6-aminohexanoate hydrolase [Listeria monocytogenes]|nr:6-aminohexanoate hydrolase [Listeria monocytogenes]
MNNIAILPPEKFLMIDELVKKKYSNIRGLSVFQNETHVMETYYGRKTKKDKFNVASITKSVISLLIGIAIDKAYIRSVNEKVIDFFPEYKFTNNNVLRNQVTIKNLLTMTTPFPFPNMREPLTRICRQKDWVEYSLKIMGSGGRIGTFKYSTSGAHLLSAILTKATKMSAREFANKYLFEPLSIETVPNFPMKFDLDHVFGSKMKGWVSDPLGNNAGGWGLTLTLNEMSKLGQLCLHEGYFNGKQIISKEWLEESTCQVKNSYGYYGYLWWVRHNKEEYMAVGSGGNIIYINKNKRIVIAIASTIISKPADRQELIDKILSIL